ncbi:hypothetical protein BCF11_2496 [Collimonas sp. PA-H2]|uniref:hypothetical protein n=1 Tax=Collimonas sp. PA-H2 TaxID=1881062 RepID=UPI000C00A086|nr:hypothetical protein [Collimonas sp. PA-H2]PFH10087.1 hypothetical protein BCF11_2496 [Collimonas sp. PA-H2]
MWKMLRGDCGLDVKFSFDPLIGPNKDLGPWSEKEQQDFEQKIRFQNWGRENMLLPEKTHFPPPEIW